MWLKHHLNFLKEEVHFKEFLEAMCMVAPIIYLSVHTKNELWTYCGIVAISNMTAAQKTSLTFLGMFLHAIVINIGFILLYFSLINYIFFVLSCMLLGCGVVLLESYGENLRSLANYTFIPTLYLACHALERMGTISPEIVITILPYTITGSLCTLVIHTSVEFVRHGLHSRFFQNNQRGFFFNQFSKLSTQESFGKKLIYYKGFMIAIACAVGLTSFITQALYLNNAQWAIWSATSVITGDIETAKKKLIDRISGSFVGAVMGITASYFLPHTQSFHDLCILLVVIFYNVFQTYVIGITVRSAFIVIAIMAANGTVTISEERILNIVFGGVAGCTALICVSSLIYYKYGSRLEET